MKTFDELEFLDHPICATPIYRGAKQATMDFDNGYGISVIFGKMFYSNGIDTYEAAILYNGSITYSSGLCDDVAGYITKQEVTELMRRIQELPK